MKGILFIVLLLISSVSFASASFVASLGYGSGGESIVEEKPHGYFIDIDDDLRMGDGVRAEMGVHVSFPHNMGMRFLVGNQYKSLKISQTQHTMQTYPLSMLFYYTVRRVSFGGGVTYHLNPVYKARGVNNDTANFEDALGVSALVNIRLTRSEMFSLEIKYTDINYSGAEEPAGSIDLPNVRSGTSYKGNSLAVSAVFRF